MIVKLIRLKNIKIILTMNKNNKYDNFWEHIEKEGKYRQGVDYTIEKIGEKLTEYKIISQELGEIFTKYCNTTKSEEFDFWQWNNLSSEEKEREIARENEKKRQKFIIENSPTNCKNCNFDINYDWWVKQPPFTASELKALNDPLLTHGDLIETLHLIQKIRQANSEKFCDEDFAWGDFMFERMMTPKESIGKSVQALKKAGISLDKLLQRVEKGRQTKQKNKEIKKQDNKQKLLANLADWELKEDDRTYSTHRPKTNQILEWYKNGINSGISFPTIMQYGGQETNWNAREDFDNLTNEDWKEIKERFFPNSLKDSPQEKRNTSNGQVWKEKIIYQLITFFRENNIKEIKQEGDRLIITHNNNNVPIVKENNEPEIGIIVRYFREQNKNKISQQDLVNLVNSNSPSTNHPAETNQVGNKRLVVGLITGVIIIGIIIIYLIKNKLKSGFKKNSGK